MHLSTATALLLSLGSALAQNDPVGSANNPLLFTATALGPHLHGAPIAANGKAFWIGKPTTTAGDGGDPLSAVNSQNTKNNNTLIFKYVNGQGTLNLDVGISGGQAVFVDGKTGDLEFTKGHDFSKIPEGGVSKGFATQLDAKIEFEGQGFYACPVPKKSKRVFRIVAKSRSKGKGCVGFTFKLHQVEPQFKGGPATAWQYV